MKNISANLQYIRHKIQIPIMTISYLIKITIISVINEYIYKITRASRTVIPHYVIIPPYFILFRSLQFVFLLPRNWPILLIRFLRKSLSIFHLFQLFNLNRSCNFPGLFYRFHTFQESSIRYLHICIYHFPFHKIFVHGIPNFFFLCVQTFSVIFYRLFDNWHHS